MTTDTTTRDPSAEFDVRGRTALVTGSSRGIGLALALGLARAGVGVALNGRDADAVDRATDELTSQGLRAGAFPFDVTDPDQVAGGVARVEDELGPIDILVNNAGVQIRIPFLDFPVEEWNRIVATNLTSVFLVSQAVGRRMAARAAGGVVVNIASVQSLLARPGIAPYCATKGAVAMMTKAMGADLGPLGIRVNALAPGYLDTELTSALVADADFTRWVTNHTPAGRWGEVEDLVGTLLYLVSPASRFVTGQTLYVDGGISTVL